MTSGQCQQCPYVEGLFNDSKSTCTHCSHAISTHSSKALRQRFSNNTAYLIHRTDLVKTVIDRLRQMHVIIIRAPPQVGKSILMRLIGREIIQNHPDLELVDILWKLRGTESIEKRSYRIILDQNKDRAKKRNEKVREELGLAKRGSSTTVFIIDNVVNTYNKIVI